MFVLRLVLFLLPVLAACLPRTAHAQTPADTAYQYIPFPTDSAEWKVHWLYWGAGRPKPIDKAFTVTYSLKGDSVLANGKIITKVHKTIASKINDSLVTNSTLQYIRTEGKKVYIPTKLGSSTQPLDYQEALLYDFGLKVGESFETFNRSTLVLVDTTYETVFGVKRKKFIFSKQPNTYSDTDIWLEGIGSLSFGLFEVGLSMVDLVDTLYLACFSQYGSLKYLSAGIDDCKDSVYTLNTHRKAIFTNSITVHPVPASNVLNIAWENLAGFGTTILVRSIDGRIVYPQTAIHPQASQTEISVAGWAPSVYTIQIQRFGRTVYSQLVTISN